MKGRKGHSKQLRKSYKKSLKNGEVNESFIYIDIEVQSVSSTKIRKSLLKLLNDRISYFNENTNETAVEGNFNVNKSDSKAKDDEENLNEVFEKNQHQFLKSANIFRKNVQNMLHPKVIEYLINNIEDVWMKANKVESKPKKTPWSIFSKHK